jgi:hypothetical protein
MGAATTLAITGVRAAGSLGGLVGVVVDGDCAVSREPSVDDEQEAMVSASAPRTATIVRVPVGMPLL